MFKIAIFKKLQYLATVKEEVKKFAEPIISVSCEFPLARNEQYRRYRLPTI